MLKSESIIIKLEFDKSIKYLSSRKENLTVAECLQELGHLRFFIYQLSFKNAEAVK